MTTVSAALCLAASHANFPQAFYDVKFHMFYCFVSLVFSAGGGESECSNVLITVRIVFMPLVFGLSSHN